MGEFELEGLRQTCASVRAGQCAFPFFRLVSHATLAENRAPVKLTSVKEGEGRALCRSWVRCARVKVISVKL